jgi:hypothetical protein
VIKWKKEVKTDIDIWEHREQKYTLVKRKRCWDSTKGGGNEEKK